MRRALWLWITVASLVLGGCGSPDVPFGGVRRPKEYRSLVSLSPSTTEILCQLQLNGNDRLKGRTKYDNYPAFSVNRIPIVADVKPDYEKIAEVHPDMILYDGSLYKGADIDKIKSLGVETLAFNAKTVDEFIKNIYLLANKLGGETYASDYVDKIIAAEAGAATPGPKPSVAIIMPGKGSGDMIVGTKSFLADIVRVSGGKLVGPEADEFVALNPEELVQLDPDYIVTSGDPSPVFKDPKLQTLKAIKLKHIFGVNPDVLLRAGSRVDSLITGIHDHITKQAGSVAR